MEIVEKLSSKHVIMGIVGTLVFVFVVGVIAQTSGSNQAQVVSSNRLNTKYAADAQPLDVGGDGQGTPTDPNRLPPRSACARTPMPAGLINQTVRCDGQSWVAAPNLLNNGINVGVNTVPSTNQGVMLKVDGGVQVLPSKDATACTAVTRGTFWFNQQVSGVQDSAMICVKEINNQYSWRKISLGEIVDTTPPPPPGITLSFFGQTADNVHDPATTTADYGVFTITLDVHASGDTYIARTAVRNQSSDPSVGGVLYSIKDQNGSIVTTGTATGVLERISGGTVSGNYYHLADETGRIRLTVYFDPALTGTYKLQLNAVNFANNAISGTSQTVALPATNYQTNSVLIQN